MPSKRFISPFVAPVAAFAAAILAGALLLWLDVCAKDGPVAFVDALFIATSAVCVTGLASVDPSTVFNPAGHAVMLALIQLGGLGIVTYSTLILYMAGRRISLGDRLAVGQALLHDSSFHLGKFLQRIVATIVLIEAAGALCLYLMYPERVGLFHAVFLAVSAFCNAGFALWPDNLLGWRQDLGLNMVIMTLIVVGGIGFFVIDEGLRIVWSRLRPKRGADPLSGSCFGANRKPCFSHSSRLVLVTTAWLVAGGALLFFLFSFANPEWEGVAAGRRVLPALFQSVTSRTAGFATMDMSTLSDAALLLTIVLMFIGGSPGSCAGGIKTTTFRALLGYMKSNLRGHRQVRVGGRALDSVTLNKVMLLFFFSCLTVGVAALALNITENGFARHTDSPFAFLDLLFEVVSAFGTVGLSINLTPQLSAPGKLIICLVMFVGRLGPIWLITAIQQFQTEPAYRLPEQDIPIG